MPRSGKAERPALGRAAIVAAARRIADAEGLDGLTLRRVAAEFGTGQASLYRHIASRAELLGLLADDLVAHYPIAPPDAVGSAADVVRQWRALHDRLADHAWAPGLIAGGVYLATAADDTTRALTAQLERIGLDAPTAARTYRALWHLTLGHLLSDHPFGHHHAAEEPRPPRDPRTPAGDDYAGELGLLIAGALAAAEPHGATPA